MTAIQTRASNRFLEAMGSMVEDERKVNAAMRFIVSLREEKLSIDPDFKNKPMYTVEEYFDGLAKDLGEEYGMNDIREAV